MALQPIKKISGKIKRLIPNKLRTKRAGYFGMVLLILFSIFVYDIYFRSPKVKAATIGSSSDSAATGMSLQRHLVVTSRGVQVAFFNAGTSSPAGVSYSVSTDNGATWGAVTQVNNTSTNSFSVVIDQNDNIHLTYWYLDASTNPIIGYQKLSRTSQTTWSIGSTVAVVTGTACDISGGNFYNNPVVAINSLGKIYISFWDETVSGGFGPCTGSITYHTDTYYSTDGSTWSVTPSITGNSDASILSVGTSMWLLKGTSIYVDISSSGTWKLVGSITSGATNISMSYGLDTLHFLYNASSQVQYQSYSITSGTFSSATVISSSANDIAGQISTDSQNTWAIWQQYVGTNSYNVVYKRYNGSAWDSSSTSITTDNLNNVSVNAAARTPNSANIPVIWTTGTASPYSVKASVFSSNGSVTDTGNQTGTYSGSLTGSSGDVIVKCGTWYYNTVNIVSGMTVKVCSSNGQTGGRLIIYANSVTVAGTIDGSGRGLPGGISVIGAGGAGGTGCGGVSTALIGNQIPGCAGNAGSVGQSFAGGQGAGSFGASGGSSGTNGATGGAGGIAGTAPNTNTDGGGGGGGGVSASVAGSNASALGGYLGAGVNGDSSTDESIAFGSGGGGGGSGGSGSGGGGGGSGGTTGNSWDSGCGGGGANGANGGLGGKGGNGGALVGIYSSGSLTVSGNINITGAAGQTGSAGSSGATGGTGVAAANLSAGC